MDSESKTLASLVGKILAKKWMEQTTLQSHGTMRKKPKNHPMKNNNNQKSQ